MYYLGVYSEASADIMAVAIFHQGLAKNLKKHYRLLDIQQTSARDSTARLMALYRDVNFVTRKRVFSQDKRPKKEVRAHPKIILAAGGKKKPDLLTNLRQAGIPADGLALLAQAAPRPLDRSGLGLDIEVCPTALIETLNTLWRENRLEMEAGLQEKALATIWSRLGPPFDPAELGPEKTTIMAVAAPLWFRENNRHRQSYQSSAKSVRRFT